MRYLFVSFVWLWALSAAAYGADITGAVTMPHGGAAVNAVVYLDGAVKSRPIEHVEVNQRMKMFMPHVTVVTQGSTVSFPNDDTVMHNVFAYYDAKRFDLGIYPRGETKHVTFDKVGVVALLCNIHSDMSAFIVIVDTPYFAITGPGGKYHIDGVEPGRYTVHVWHETGAAAEQTVDVTGSQSLDLALTRR